MRTGLSAAVLAAAAFAGSAQAETSPHCGSVTQIGANGTVSGGHSGFTEERC